MDNYKILRAAPVVFKVLAGIGISMGLISCIAIIISGGTPQTPRWMGIVSLVAGVVYSFFFMVAADGIKVLLEIKDRIK